MFSGLCQLTTFSYLGIWTVNYTIIMIYLTIFLSLAIYFGHFSRIPQERGCKKVVPCQNVPTVKDVTCQNDEFVQYDLFRSPLFSHKYPIQGYNL